MYIELFNVHLPTWNFDFYRSMFYLLGDSYFGTPTTLQHMNLNTPVEFLESIFLDYYTVLFQFFLSSNV